MARNYIIQIRCEKETKTWFKEFAARFDCMEDALKELLDFYKHMKYT